MIVEEVVRVSSIRSSNPQGFGGCIFTGRSMREDGSVRDARGYIVVEAPANVLLGIEVEAGQWWRVVGTSSQFKREINGFQIVETQVTAESLEPLRPSGRHLVDFIAEQAAFQGIGPLKAKKLWDAFGEDLYRILDAGDAAMLTSVLTTATAAQAVAAWAQCGIGQTLRWLQSNKFDIALGRKVIQFFGRATEQKLQEDPYRLLSFCANWRDVDQLARTHFAVAPDDPRRLRGAVEEACYRLFALGHTSVLSNKLMSALQSVLGAQTNAFQWRHLISQAVTEGLQNGSFVVGAHGVQPLGAFAMERQVALSVASRLRSTETFATLDIAGIDEALSDYETREGFQLNAEQRGAVHLAARHPFALITGGAGVGKTTVLKALYEIYDRAGIAITQLALAGRAAKRMQEATGRPASTIAHFLHSAREGSFDERCVFVIDEASMVDIISMSRLCDVFESAPRILLVGDPAQLMPVGPGLVLHALTEVDRVPLARLTLVKRYGGQITSAATAIRDGRWPELGSDTCSDIAFVQATAGNTAEGRFNLAETVLKLFAVDPEASQVLCSRKGGLEGTEVINALCQKHFTASNPPVLSWSEQHKTTVLTDFHLGDRVLCTKNLWDYGIQNGSLGKIVEVTEEGVVTSPDEDGDRASRPLAWVDWDDGIRRPITEHILDYLKLGFAITVHKAQGSQWPRVIVPVAQSRLLDRTLVYTAVTRAQKQVLLVGDEAAAKNAVEAPQKSQERSVCLHLHLRQCLLTEAAP